MPVATWNGHEIARSDNTVVVEGNHYFPADSIDPTLLEDSATHSNCPWKGVASYKTLVVDGKRNVDAVWYYPEPKSAAAEIEGRYAFWKGVTVGLVIATFAVYRHPSESWDFRVRRTSRTTRDTQLSLG